MLYKEKRVFRRILRRLEAERKREEREKKKYKNLLTFDHSSVILKVSNERELVNMKKTYNGWENRETWLVNLHFGDAFEEAIISEIEETGEKMDVSDIAERYEEFVTSTIDEETANLSPFLQDLIDLKAINWYELAEAVAEG